MTDLFSPGKATRLSLKSIVSRENSDSGIPCAWTHSRRFVCKKCNETWMSDIEARISTSFSQIIRSGLPSRSYSAGCPFSRRLRLRRQVIADPMHFERRPVFQICRPRSFSGSPLPFLPGFRYGCDSSGQRALQAFLSATVLQRQSATVCSMCTFEPLWSSLLSLTWLGISLFNWPPAGGRTSSTVGHSQGLNPMVRLIRLRSSLWPPDGFAVSSPPSRKFR